MDMVSTTALGQFFLHKFYL